MTSFNDNNNFRNWPESEKPPEKLWGKEYIEDVLSDLGVTFVISPTSFFQVNKSAGEKLYSAVAELAHIDSDTSVVDICCASGGIALTLSKVTFLLFFQFLCLIFWIIVQVWLKLF